MRAVSLSLLPLLAAGCVPEIPGLDIGGSRAPRAPSAEARIAEVEASPSRLVVRLTDGARCVALRPEGERAGWSGVTSECGYALPYTVTFAQSGSRSRFIIEDPTGVPIGPDGGPGPRAEVFITDVNGQRRLFIAPLDPDVRFEPAPPA